MIHTDETTCLQYIDGQLDSDRAVELTAHVQACAECRALLRALERETALLRRSLAEEEEAVPARVLAVPERDRAPWGWIVSLGFAALGAYMVWTGIESWQQQLEQAGLGGGNLLTLLFFGGVFWEGWKSMIDLVEVFAAIGLGLIALHVFRRNWRRWTAVGVVVGGLALALALPQPAQAAEVKKNQYSYTLRSGEVVKNDLIVIAQTARIDGTVEGDLIFFGQEVTINGKVTGDVFAFGQTADVNGVVEGSVRSGGRTVAVRGSVKRNVIFFGETTKIDSKAEVGGSVMAFGGFVTVDGRVGRDTLIRSGNATVTGWLGGDLDASADDHFTIGPTAEVQGKTRFRGRKKPEISPEAKLASPPEITMIERKSRYLSFRFYLGQALRWAAAFVFGMVLYLLIPVFFTDVIGSTGRFWASLGIGLLTLLACILLALVALLLLIIGVPLGVVAMALFLPAVYGSQVFVGAWVGQRMFGEALGSASLLGRLAVGLLVLRVVTHLPYIGWLVTLVMICWGLGALLLTMYRRLQPGTAAA